MALAHPASPQPEAFALLAAQILNGNSRRKG